MTRRTSSRLSAVAVCSGLLFASACGPSETAESAGATQEATEESQRVEVAVGAGGYAPSTVPAVAGQPLTLVFTRTTDEGCGQVLAIPAHDIRRDLPLNEPVEVTFTPTEAGDVRFTCGMDMYDGTVVVR